MSSLALPYSETPEYRASVIAFATAATASLPRVIADGDVAPAAHPLAYHHIGIACTSIPDTLQFYAKLGFKVAHRDAGSSREGKAAGIVVLSNGKLELHIIQADARVVKAADGSATVRPLTDATPAINILMDTPSVKHPGHTHASWTVPSVPSVKSFFANQGIELSGTRSTLAVFVRDTDRTTLEFERNDGADEPPTEFTPAHIGAGRPLDHVGIRVRAPYERHIEFYARHLGFERIARTYEPSADPLQNFSPWITRTAAGVDINWIINASTPAPDSGAESDENVLFASEGLLPGIAYAAFAISETSAVDVVQRLVGAGVDAKLDVDVAANGWGNFPRDALRVRPDAPTVLVRDLCGTIVRLVPTA